MKCLKCKSEYHLVNDCEQNPVEEQTEKNNEPYNYKRTLKKHGPNFGTMMDVFCEENIEGGHTCRKLIDQSLFFRSRRESEETDSGRPYTLR